MFSDSNQLIGGVTHHAHLLCMCGLLATNNVMKEDEANKR
jgi:hypothetical protein